MEMLEPASALHFTTDNDDNNSVLSEGDFEREIVSQSDLQTTSHSTQGGDASSSSRQRLSNIASTSGLTGSTSTGDANHSTKTTSTGLLFPRRVFLIPLLVYLIFFPEVSWPLQVAAQMLLAFVMLTLAVRLTSTPPQMFTMAASEAGLKEILEKSRTLLAQEPQPAHSPGSQSTIGALLLMAVLVSVAYLQASGCLQVFVEQGLFPLANVHSLPPSVTPTPSPSSVPTVADLVSDQVPLLSPRVCLTTEDCDITSVHRDSNTPGVFLSSQVGVVKQWARGVLAAVGGEGGWGEGWGWGLGTWGVTTSAEAKTALKQSVRGGEARAEAVAEAVAALSAGSSAATTPSDGAASLGASVSEDPAHASSSTHKSDNLASHGGAIPTDRAAAAGLPPAAGADGQSVRLDSREAASEADKEAAASKRMSVHVSVAHLVFTPYGTGLLAPGGNLTFCGAPQRPSLWARLGRRGGESAATRHASSASATSSSLCDVQVMTLDEKGLVVIQRVGSWGNLGAGAGSTDESSDTDSPSSPENLANTSIHTKSRSNSVSVVWKGNCFSLWKRAIKKLKPLSSALLAYSFEENDLTLWKMKPFQASRGGSPDEQTTPGDGVAEEGTAVRASKPWRSFEVKSI